MTISMHEYAQMRGINWSALKHFRTSPKHFLHAMEERKDAGFLRVGRITHALLLEPDKARDHYVVYPGKVRRGKEWTAFQGQHEGCEIVTQSELDTALAITSAILSDDGVRSVLHADIVEQPITWTDEEHGVLCKGIPDVVGDGALIDVKTAASVEPGIFGAAAARFGYHAQLAFYRDGLEANGCRISDVAIIAAESKPPHDVVVYRLGEHELALGRDLYRELLKEYVECTQTGYWPGVARGELLDLRLPAWAGGVAVGDDLDWSGVSE